jgi:hypothetical protein
MSKDIYVVVEQRDGNISKVGLELIGEATKLAARRPWRSPTTPRRCSSPAG